MTGLLEGSLSREYSNVAATVAGREARLRGLMSVPLHPSPLMLAAVHRPAQGAERGDGLQLQGGIDVGVNPAATTSISRDRRDRWTGGASPLSRDLLPSPTGTRERCGPACPRVEVHASLPS